MTLAERLQALLRIKQWSLSDLEQASGVSKGYLAQMTRGENANPTLETLRSLARSFGTTIAEIVGDDPSSATSTLPKVADSLHRFIKGRAKLGDELSEAEIRSLSLIGSHLGNPDTDDDWFGLLWAIRRATEKRRHPLG